MGAERRRVGGARVALATNPWMWGGRDWTWLAMSLVIDDVVLGAVGECTSGSGECCKDGALVWWTCCMGGALVVRWACTGVVNEGVNAAGMDVSEQVASS